MSSDAPRAFLTGDRLAGLVLVIIAALVAVETRALPLGSLGRPGPGWAPLAYAAILAVLGLAVAARRGGTPVAWLGWGDWRHAAVILACGVFAALMIERIGYRLTVLAVLAFLLGAVERRWPPIVAAVAVGVSFGSYFVFWNLLRVPLPTGPFGL